jgi:CheY-like chemotaxis protein
VNDLNDIQQTLQKIRVDRGLPPIPATPDPAAGTVSTTPAPLTLSTLEPRLRRSMQQFCAEHGKKAGLCIDDAGTALDPAQVDRVMPALEQLLLNAVQHGIEATEQRQSRGKPACGQIDICLSREGNDFVISIRDDGAGINISALREQAMAKGLLTESRLPDHQDMVRLMLQPGMGVTETGTGLKRVDAIIRKLGGRLDGRSTLNQGACFSLRWPEQGHVPEVVTITIPQLSTEQVVDSGLALVMIVDDSLAARRVSERLLRRYDYLTVSAADGGEALLLLQHRRPVLILVDMDMPGMNGVELVKALDRDERYKNIPVIMITPHGSSAPRLVHGGVIHYLSKPYSEPELIALIESMELQPT